MYKRQVLINIIFERPLSAILLLTAFFDHTNEIHRHAYFLLPSNTVSHTHLDVYKRQAHESELLYVMVIFRIDMSALPYPVPI